MNNFSPGVICHLELRGLIKQKVDKKEFLSQMFGREGIFTSVCMTRGVLRQWICVDVRMNVLQTTIVLVADGWLYIVKLM